MTGTKLFLGHARAEMDTPLLASESVEDASSRRSAALMREFHDMENRVDGSGLAPIRRVVTGDDTNGLSHIISDGPSPAVKTVAQRPGYRVTNLWCTAGVPTHVDAPDAIVAHAGLPPPANGTLLRVVDYPPETGDVADRKR